jgi:CHAT domain-containing protein
MRFKVPALFVFLLILSASIYADEAQISSTAKALAGKLIASEKRDSLLNELKNEITPEVCEVLISEAQNFFYQSDYAKATSIFQLSQQASEQIGYKTGLAKSIRGLGAIHSVQGDNAKAIEYFNESLKLAKEIGDKETIAATLRSIGIYHNDLGNDDLALNKFHESLSIAEEIGNNDLTAAALNGIGFIHMFNGNYSEALQYLTKASTTVKRKTTLASVLTNIAVVYDLQGNQTQALNYYQKTLKLWEELGNKGEIANVLNNIGDYRLLGDYDLALEYNNKALAIAEEIGDKKRAGMALANIGNAYRNKGNLEQALEYTNRSLRLAQDLSDLELVASQMRQAARIYYAKGEFVRALQYAESSVVSSKKVNSRQLLWAALEIKGKSYRALNKTEKANESFAEAITTIEDWRSKIAGGEVEQLNLFAEKASVYNEMIDLLIQQNRVDDAFSYAERVKGRVLMDVLRSGKIQISEAMTEKEVAEEKTWSKRLVDLSKQIQAETDSANIKRLGDELQKARLDFESYRTTLYVNHPELRVKRGEAITITLQDTEELIDTKSALVEFVVGEDKTYVFVVTKDSNEVYPIKIQQKQLTDRVQEFRQQISERSPKFQKAAKELFELLILPFYENLQSKEKVVIVPDAVLWELPFQALMAKDGKYLLQNHILSYVPSITVYREMKMMKKEKKTELSLLAFGNPLVQRGTEERLNYVVRSDRLNPLPETEKEVRSLQELYGQSDSHVYVQGEAQEERLKEEARNSKILHLATHGILNPAAPLYSQIVLSQRGNDDGLLEAWEIMNLKLNADLVVLSACDTALGKVSNGEGMIGLTWAFFIAGSSTTVVSQWKVLSASTTELMLAFHKNLHSSEVHSSAEALRNAALKLMQKDEYRHPFYWAPFVVIGSDLNLTPQ